MAKKRLVKDYDALPEEITKVVKQKYPTGYEQHLVTYKDKEGKIVSALPFETDEIYYLIRMTVLEAKRLVKNDEDFDDDGVLRQSLAGTDVDVESEFDGEGEDEDDDLAGGEDESDHIIVTRRGRGDDMDDIPDGGDY